MGKLNIKNGTPIGNTHLCKRCSWGQCIAGYRASDLLLICTYTTPNIVVPFTVFDCSEFDDKFRPSRQQMEKLAIEVQPGRVSRRTAGFNAVAKVQPIRRTDADDEEDEIARLF